jgi:dolichyl-diphosphooligosaccharide--protein glycosyltransferase/undecaprenyl-diphosphooligosaccharide--protein glycosyltransferase
MANRISGSTIGVIVSLIGYILLVIRYRPFILALPLIGIGVFSLIGGLRFTVYAVPIAAIGAVYLFYVISNFISNRWLKYSFIALMSGVMLYPNITHIIEYKVPTVFNKSEVKILDQLKTIASPKDYTLTWWDYGYPIWYYSDTNTLIDGGKHNNDNFIISKILATDNQVQAANLARLSIETYVDSNYSTVADTIFRNKQKDQLDPNIFLENLKSEDYQLPQKSRDIYLYLPYKMISIFPTILQFSNLDLNGGNKIKNNFFYYSPRFVQDKGVIYLGNNISLHEKTGMLHLGSKQTSLKEFITVGYAMDGRLVKDKKVVNPNANISLIFLKSYGSFLLVDEKMLNSTFVKLFILEEYDKNLFEPVIMDPMTKVYRLKR